MNIAVEITEPRLIGINVNDNEIKAFLTDGRTISVPLVLAIIRSHAKTTPEL